MQAQGSTHLGQRENNEDFFLVDLDSNLFIVADGMGGHNAGEIASSLAAAAVKDYISTEGSDNIAATMENAFQAANGRVFAHASLESTQEGMGTTLTALRVVGSKAYIAHVGDSRAYLVRDMSIERITSDHSLVQEMVENGGLSEVEARTHPKRNILTRAVGTQSHAMVDVFEVSLHESDTILLCTDGLSGVLCDQEILDIIKSSKSVEQSSTRLVNLAAQKGGQDNITAIIIYFDSL